MLSTEVTTRIRETIGAQVDPRDGTLDSALRAEMNRLAARGMIASGNAISSFSKIAMDELRVRGRITWSAIQRAYGSMDGRVNESTLADLQTLLAEHINAQAAKVRAVALERVKNVVRDESHKALMDVAISNTARELLREAKVEAQFYVDDLRRAASRAGAASVPLITIQGNVGALLTGTYGTAHVSLNASDRDDLIEALSGLRLAIAQSTVGSAEDRAQSAELATDVITAASADKPNGPKIAGLLHGLATTVQTVASLQGAWNIVRTTAKAAGIPLP